MLLDPASARVLASRWLERSPLHALHALHTELYLGGRGRVAVGALGLLLVLQGATGLFLWWPFTRRLPRGFTIRRGRRWRVLGYDLHKVIGIASLAFHVPVALTGALLALSTGAGPTRSGSVEVRERDGSVARLDRRQWRGDDRPRSTAARRCGSGRWWRRFTRGASGASVAMALRGRAG